MIFTPLAVWAAGAVALAVPAFGLLTMKNELTKLAKSLFKKLTRKKKDDKDILAKQRRMETAYVLIC